MNAFVEAPEIIPVRGGRWSTDAELCCALLDGLADWIWETDRDGRIHFISPQVRDALGYPSEEVVGKQLEDLMPPLKARPIPPPRKGAANPRAFRDDVYHFVNRSGCEIPFEVSAVPVYDRTGSWAGYLGACRSATSKNGESGANSARLAEAVALAQRDPLTGILNRSAYHQRLEARIAQARRDRESFAVVLIDLDNFRFFNEAYGHLVGDSVLRLVARHLCAFCGPEDAAARLGGDEFAILLPGARRKEAQVRIAELARGIAVKGFLPEGHKAPIPLAIATGVAAYPEDFPQGQKRDNTRGAATVLMRSADLRLYDCKSRDRDFWSNTIRDDWKRTVPGYAILDGLLVAVQVRDRYTEWHSEEVLLYSSLIADNLNFSSPEMETIQLSAFLHDAGMIGVPEKLLRRPGKLNTQEFATVQMHAAMGAAIVSGTAPMLHSAAHAIHHHHEYWNGSGYPDGLKGEAIPLAARIIAVADAFSAMTVDRPYHAGLSPEDATLVLQAGAGSQWDPACVDVFLRVRSKER